MSNYNIIVSKHIIVETITGYMKEIKLSLNGLLSCYTEITFHVYKFSYFYAK